MTAQPVETQTLAQSPVAIACQFCEKVWGQGDLAALYELTSDDFTIFYPIMSAPLNRDAYAALMTDVHTGFPDFRVTVEEAIAQGNQVVVRWAAEGTQTGPIQLLNLPPTGRAVRYSGMVIYRMAQGKIFEARGEEDTLGLLKQLGVLG